MKSFVFLFFLVGLLCVTQASSQTVWAKYSGNPVLDAGPSGSWEVLGVGAPSVIRHLDTLKMWYSGRSTATVYEMGYAWSTDGGVSWTKYASNPVLSPAQAWEATFLFLTDVINSGSSYKMWYTAGQSARHHIGYATSTDGRTWTRLPYPVLDPGPSSWDLQNVGWPSILGPDTLGNYKMWYSGHGTSPYLRRIGYATAANETIWTKYENNPVLPLGSSGSWDDGGLEAPDVLYTGGFYEMWYSGYRTSFWADSRIGYAKSSDGISWTRHTANPVLPTGPPGSWDVVSVTAGEIFFDGSIYQMWYTGYDGSTLRIGHAVSPKGLAVSVSTADSVINSVDDTISVTVRVNDPAGLQFSAKILSGGTPLDTLELFDDGTHGDSLASDGVFANNWIPHTAGVYSVDLVLTLHDTLRFEMKNAAVNLVTTVKNAEFIAPQGYHLSHNFPNPFNPTTEIRYQISEVSHVTLKVFDMLGREVATLVNAEMKPGSYMVTWDASGFPSGTYFYKLTAGEFVETKKLLLLR